MSASNENPATVVQFWRDAGPPAWFAKSDDFDTRLRTRFLDAHMAAARREHENWMHDAEGALALMILLDQFPRNAFRNTGHMYATDALALHYAKRLLESGFDQQIETQMRVFCYLPFSHSEDLEDQVRAVALNQGIGQPWLAHAEEHWQVVERFGRFPHRNAMLGRATTAEERAFLEAGGFSG